ncbi:GNAT family N-acetyltransferase, partial [Streptomyces sp. NPDC054838]
MNAEAELLMLGRAFETLGTNRVEFLTDVRNSASRAAGSRLGARLEGVLRSHMVMRDGWVRDSALYALTRAEWPEAKRAMTARLAAPARAAAPRGAERPQPGANRRAPLSGPGRRPGSSAP